MNKAFDQYRVFGNPIAHSKSPLIHSMFAQQTQQNLNYETAYVALDGFAAAVQTFVDAGGKGANVTVPFKLEAVAVADQLTERAAAAGAVNTLVFSDAGIVGDNTDGAGLVRDIVHNAEFAIAGKRVLMLGAGGAARGALLPLLREHPAELVIANRTVSKAFDLVAIAQQFDTDHALCSAATWTELDGKFDLIINATSSSLSDDVPPISEQLFTPSSLAYDMMYGDMPTSFMRFAERAGARSRDGLGMLIEQAAEAFQLWRGVRPQTDGVFAQMKALKNGERK